jgi:hypothetical protein
VFSRVFIAEEVDGVGDRLEDTTKIDVQTMSEAFRIFSGYLSASLMKLLLVRKNTSWNYCPKVLDHQDFPTTGYQIKVIFL